MKKNKNNNGSRIEPCGTPADLLERQEASYVTSNMGMQ